MCMARLKEAKLCNIVLVPSRLSASGRNKLHYYHQRLQSPAKALHEALHEAPYEALQKLY